MNRFIFVAHEVTYPSHLRLQQSKSRCLKFPCVELWRFFSAPSRGIFLSSPPTSVNGLLRPYRFSLEFDVFGDSQHPCLFLSLQGWFGVVPVPVLQDKAMPLLRFPVIEVDAPPSATSSGISIDVGIWIRRQILPVEDEFAGGGCHLEDLWCQRFVDASTATTDIWWGVNAVSTLPYCPKVPV